MSEFGSSPIVVTGATGWVGRTVVDQLAKMLPQDELRSRLRAFGSRSGVIEHVHGMPIPIMPLSELPSLVKQEGCCYFLHAAFLTPERCAELGIEAYRRINRSITDTIATAVKASPNARVVEFSSGAASYVETNQAMSSSAAKLYGALKLEEEQRLQKVGTTIVLRIYALTGRFIRNPATYALGEFLLFALQNRQINVRSTIPVIRGYVSATDLARVAISWLVSGDPTLSPMAAVNEIVTLERLSVLISTMYGLQPPIVHKLEGKPSSYSSSPVNFLNICRRYGVSPISLRDQILDTAKGVVCES